MQSEQANVPLRETGHLPVIGRMIEDMEIQLRGDLDVLYIQKTKEVVNSIRLLYQAHRQGASHIASLKDAVHNHGDQRVIDSES